MNRPRCWSASAYEANSSFISRSFITFRAICSLWSIDGARFWDCLSLSSARRDRRNYRARAARQVEKRSRPRLRPQIPTSTLLKPSQDQEGPPCQVWGRWDLQCGRASITHKQTFDKCIPHRGRHVIIVNKQTRFSSSPEMSLKAGQSLVTVAESNSVQFLVW